MQAVQQQPTQVAPPVAALLDGALSPSAMALHLRRTSGSAALCFAKAMHEGAAWANESWGAYWADVIKAV